MKIGAVIAIVIAIIGGAFILGSAAHNDPDFIVKIAVLTAIS